eukprot:COSAG01_NODE_46365_length_400_cov_8.172757_1_plen_43_part_10
MTSVLQHKLHIIYQHLQHLHERRASLGVWGPFTTRDCDIKIDY